MALQIITEIPLASGDVTPDDNPHFYIEVGGVFRRLTLPQLIDCINEDLNVSGLSNAAKQALLNCFEHVAWVDDQGQTYYDALYDALYPRPTSISAVFTQGQHVIYDTQSLDDLRQYLVVKATFEDGTEHTVVNYTLSGTLTAGTSTITVTYENCTDTFEVNVTENAGYITVEYTQSGIVYDTDTLSDLKSDLVVTYYETQQTEQGVVLTDEDYTLSGTLEVGVSTITVEYLGLTNTFGVTVTADPSYITAAYTQSETVYIDDNINDLKSDLIVTYYNREGQGTVLSDTDYTLTGTLVEGTSVITASYQGLTDTFEVANVVDLQNIHTWNFPSNALMQTTYGVWSNINGTLGISDATNRRSIYLTKGKHSCVWTGGTLPNDAYPIPIPSDATSGRITISNSLYFAASVWRYNESTGKYTNVSSTSTGWVQNSGTVNIPSGEEQYLIISYHNQNNTNMLTPDSDPSSLSLVFS